jgi:hypothetical protein
MQKAMTAVLRAHNESRSTTESVAEFQICRQKFVLSVREELGIPEKSAVIRSEP